MERKIRILSTKKLQPSQRQYLLNAGFSVVESDFISIDFTTPETFPDTDYLIFTSSNAVNSILQNPAYKSLTEKRVFCVGEKTKQLLESNGFIVAGAADCAEELFKLIPKNTNAAFTFFCGNMRLETLPRLLTSGGIKFTEVEVYRTTLIPQTPDVNPDGILFFSPSAVEAYLKNNKIIADCFCIGPTTAESLKNYPVKIMIANKPSVENVIIQCINFYKQHHNSLPINN